jgi:hypothetical protein
MFINKLRYFRRVSRGHLNFLGYSTTKEGIDKYELAYKYYHDT